MDPFENSAPIAQPEPPSFSPKPYRKAVSRLGWGAFTLMLLTQVLAVGMMYLFAAIMPPAFLVSPWYAWMLTYLPLYLVAFPIFWFMVRGLPAIQPEKKASCTPATFCKLVILCLGITYLLNYFSYFINYLLGLLKGGEVMNPLATVATDPLSSFVFGGLVAPIMEELTYRKIILNRLMPMGERTAVYGTAFLFALFHANLSQLFYAFVLGIILAQLAVRTGSIRASIGLHIAINCVGTVLVPMVAGLGESMEWVLVGFVLLCIAGGIVTLKFLPRVQTAPSPLPLTGGQQRKIFFLNSGMIAYMVLILILIVMVILA